MNSLFNISEEYLNLMRQIEDAEGDLTPELEEALKINEKEAEKKIKAYHYIIKNNESEINLIKDEKERLSNLAKTKENLITKLKSRVLDAVTLFGYTGKSNNKKLDYDTLKLYTVNKDKIEVNEENFIKDAFDTLLNDTETDVTSAFQYTISSKLNKMQIRKLFELGMIEITEVHPDINKTKIGSLIDEGIVIPHCSKINNPYIVFK